MNIKKIFILFLSFTLFLCNPDYVSAETSTSQEPPHEYTYSSETFYYDSETGEFSYANEHTTYSSFDEIILQSSNNPYAKGSNIDLFTITSGLKHSKNGVFTWFFNLDCPTSIALKPDTTLKATLKASFTTNTGTFSTIATKSNRFNIPTEYALDYTFTTTAKTGYYYIEFTLTNHSNGDIQSIKTTKELYNRSGSRWTFNFSATGKGLGKPRADWTKGYLYNRPSGLADKYYQLYYNTFGITLDKSEYQVHHIQPLSLGGSNDFSNLIHLPIGLHTQVTGWFNGY